MKKKVKKILVIFLIVALWQLAYSIFSINNYLLPPPLEIAKAFLEVLNTKEIFFHILATLSRVLIGVGSATIFGVILGLFLGYNKRVGEYFTPIVEILRPIPPIAWIPIAILIFGLGNTSAYFIVFLGAFFPIFSNSYFGADSLPVIYRKVSSSLELSKIVFYRKILLKYSYPYIFEGVKIGMGMGWMSVIAAEFIGAQSGLGYFIQLNRLMLQIDKVLVGMIIIGIIGYLLNKIIIIIENKVINWR